MNQTVCILGRQPGLGLAELESLFGADALQPIGTDAAIVDQPPQNAAIDRLGGTLKTAKLLTVLPTVNWLEIHDYLVKTLPEHLGYIPEGKIRLGLSVYNVGVNIRRINATGLELKKLIKQAGRSGRTVPNKEPALSTAQVIHNQLTGPTGLELLLVRHGNQTVLAQTVGTQDIAAYGARDQARPKRDARVGMLPPKLAQIIINLTRPQADTVVLDPFCGTGVILQEALLAGYSVYGTDLEPRMIEYSKFNLEWLSALHSIDDIPWRLDAQDATKAHWQPVFNAVACETYLGRPFAVLPPPKTLNEVSQDVDTIVSKFLKNLAAQTPAGMRLCIAVPAWKLERGFRHLKTLDHLEELGYTRSKFVHVRDQELIYHRPGQVVGRELVVLVRK